MWWDGGYEQNPDGLSIKQNMKIATILPFEAAGTAAFPGHQFFLSPIYDNTDAVDRFVMSYLNIKRIDTFLRPSLGVMGYKGYFGKKKNSLQKEGCAIFWSAYKFQHV